MPMSWRCLDLLVMFGVEKSRKPEVKEEVDEIAKLFNPRVKNHWESKKEKRWGRSGWVLQDVTFV